MACSRGQTAFTLGLVVGCAGGDPSLAVLHEVLSSGLSAPSEWSPLRWKISCSQRNMLQEAAASWQISLDLAKQTPPKTQPLQPQLIAGDIMGLSCNLSRRTANRKEMGGGKRSQSCEEGGGLGK